MLLRACDLENARPFSTQMGGVVCAMWVQSCISVGYLLGRIFGSISLVIKSTMGYNQGQIAIVDVAKDLGDGIGFVTGSLCEILRDSVVLLFEEHVK